MNKAIPMLISLFIFTVTVGAQESIVEKEKWTKNFRYTVSYKRSINQYSFGDTRYQYMLMGAVPKPELFGNKLSASLSYSHKRVEGGVTFGYEALNGEIEEYDDIYNYHPAELINVQMFHYRTWASFNFVNRDHIKAAWKVAYGGYYGKGFIGTNFKNPFLLETGPVFSIPINERQSAHIGFHLSFSSHYMDTERNNEIQSQIQRLESIAWSIGYSF